MGEEREQFSSRYAFYFAAVGSAVGFGNVWRFPSLAYKFGGGAFFIPYVMALFLIGIPVLFLEISLGQYYQRGDVSVFSGIHKRMRGVGLLSIVCGYILFTYYGMLVTWVIRTFFESNKDNAPWGNENLDAEDSTGYFYGEIVGMKTLSEEEGSGFYATRLVKENALYALLTMTFVFLCSAFGVEVTGRITYMTMGLPVLLLFIFLFRGVSLDGYTDGVRAYIGNWDLSVLRKEPNIWSEAVGQIFFSLSVTFGVMTAYGSHMKRDEPALVNSVVVALANSMFSFIAGFAVFAAIGHRAFLEDKEIGDLDNLASFGLVFGTWPLVLGSLPGGIHWVRLLFFNLFLLGIDSAFSFIEAVVTCIHDAPRFKDVPRWYITAIVCVVAYLLGLVYATDAGLFFLDAVDWYVNFVMLLVGFLETFAVGWLFGFEKQIKRSGAKAYYLYMITTFGSILLASILWFTLEKNAIWAGFVALISTYAFGMGWTILFLLESANEPLPEALMDLAYGNMRDYKATLEPVIGWVPHIFCILVKHFIPQVLLILFVNLAASKVPNTDLNLFGNYGGYPNLPYQFMGILVVVLALLVFVAGVIAPSVYSGFVSLDKEIEEGTKPSFPVKKPKEVDVDGLEA